MNDFIPTQYQALLDLDELDEVGAGFVMREDPLRKQRPRDVTVDLSRQTWETLGRPARLLVKIVEQQ